MGWQAALPRIAAVTFILGSNAADAYTINITAGTRSIYLQVGAGLMTGGNFRSGGVPGNNSTVNLVSVSVPAASIGSGTQAMTTNSTQSTSTFDGANYCSSPARLYLGGFYRAPSTTGNATLTVTSPASLVNSTGQSISFNQISWITNIGSGDNASNTIPSGTFAAGSTQTLFSVATNQWFESCLSFNYANTVFPASGIYDGRVTYTLTAP